MTNLSDHNPIHTIIQMNGIKQNEAKNVDKKLFYKFHGLRANLLTGTDKS
jgi:hypothetical protein